MDLGQYVSAGFVVTRRLPRPEYTSELLPPTLVSASPDLATFIPDTWAIAWCGVEPADRRASAAKLGIQASQVDSIVAEVTSLVADSGGYGWPNICFTLQAAAVMKRLAPATDLIVLELALGREHVAGFVAASIPPPSLPGQAAFGEAGVRTGIRRDVVPTGDGCLLGFEPLVFDHALSCSWLCNGLESAVAQELGIHTNDAGLIASADQAARVVGYISRPDVGAEPGLWLPWLLIEHPHG